MKKIHISPITGFAFIELPDGWKFAGQLAAESLAYLSPSTLFAMLALDGGAAIELPAPRAEETGPRARPNA